MNAAVQTVNQSLTRVYNKITKFRSKTLLYLRWKRAKRMCNFSQASLKRLVRVKFCLW